MVIQVVEFSSVCVWGGGGGVKNWKEFAEKSTYPKEIFELLDPWCIQSGGVIIHAMVFMLF